MNKDNQQSEERFVTLMGRDNALKDLVGHLTDNFEVGNEIPSQRNLEVEIGYSRPKMREALIKLECFGFIDIQHGKPSILLKPFTE
jgi:DNA-binding FadR family transcriptional regulator